MPWPILVVYALGFVVLSEWFLRDGSPRLYGRAAWWTVLRRRVAPDDSWISEVATTDSDRVGYRDNARQVLRRELFWKLQESIAVETASRGWHVDAGRPAACHYGRAIARNYVFRPIVRVTVEERDGETTLVARTLPMHTMVLSILAVGALTLTADHPTVGLVGSAIAIAVAVAFLARQVLGVRKDARWAMDRLEAILAAPREAAEQPPTEPPRVRVAEVAPGDAHHDDAHHDDADPYEERLDAELTSGGIPSS